MGGTVFGGVRQNNPTAHTTRPAALAHRALRRIPRILRVRLSGSSPHLFQTKKGPQRFRAGALFLFGTRGRTRTGTLLRARDFESRVSTNFTTLALGADSTETGF